jgi:hypothetical protein
MKNLKKFNELYINRDEPKTPFHSSQEPKNWKDQDRFVPEPSSKPYLTQDDDLEDKLSELGLTTDDLNSFRNLLVKMKDITREFNSQEQVFTDLLLFSRLMKANSPLVNKLMGLNS